MKGIRGKMVEKIHWIINLIYSPFREKLPEQRKNIVINNLKTNWFFLVSAMAFFCCNATLTVKFLVDLGIALMVYVVIASQIPSVWSIMKKGKIWIRVVSALSAIGICWSGQAIFYAAWSVSPPGVQTSEPGMSFLADIPAVIGAFCATLGFFFVYICVLLFWQKMIKLISGTALLKGVMFGESIIYLVLLLGSLTFVTATFIKTDAFYGTEFAYDIIYTSDSPSLVKGNVYMALMHPENDLRQPLFAVFAAPFTGIPYLIGRLLPEYAFVQAILLDYVQIIMLLAANFMVTRMLKLTPAKRVCFMVTMCFTYTYLLFILMMEQYIVAYFWLIFCIFLICRQKRPNRIVLWGAGGTLLTSMVLLPFLSDKSPLRDLKKWAIDMLGYSFEFVVVILAFCRFDVIFNLGARISFLSGFTGKSVGWADKVYQYTGFIRGFFLAPKAGVNLTAQDYISWQLETVTSVNFVAITILLLCVISTWINRDKKSSLLAAGWIGFSIVMLLGIGWGTNENGLILYALYFGWAFFVLLFQLLEKIEDKMNICFLVPAVSAFCTVALAVINIPSIIEMVRFAVEYYPV